MALSDTFIHRKLEKTGNDSEMAVDGSSTAVDFTYTVPTGKTLALRSITGRLQVPKVSGSPRSWFGCGFGKEVSATLTNGVQLYIRDGSQNLELDFTVDGAIKRNSDWGNLCGGNVGQLSDDAFAFTFDLVKAFGGPINLQAGWQVVAKVRDNLTTIVDSLELSATGQLS